MFENISQWANSILCLGIFTAIVELVLPKGNVKKYIYVIIGIVTIITIISPIIKEKDYEYLTENAVETISSQVAKTEQETILVDKEEYLEYQKELVKNEYINNLKTTIWNDLVSKGVILESIDIKIKDDYEITEITINLNKYGIEEYKTKKEILDYIDDFYDISSKIINIVEVQS